MQVYTGVRYSPLCDSDPSLYQEYLRVSEQYGKSLELAGSYFRACGGARRGCIGDHAGVDDDGPVRIAVQATFCPLVGEHSRAALSGLESGPVGDRSEGEVGGGPGVGGLAGGDAGGVGGRSPDGSVCGQDSSGHADTSTGLRSEVGIAHGASARTLANRAKRQRKKLAKGRKRQAGGGPSSASGSGVSAVVTGVPEWRQKGVRATFHKGAFVDCSEDVQRELRDTRAQALAAKNRTAVVEAEFRRRQLEAKLKTRAVEEEAEVRRFKLDAEYEALAKRRLDSLPPGFAETVVSSGLGSVISVPSLNSGSVSPDSSASFAEVRRMTAAIEDLTRKLELSRVEIESLKKRSVPVKPLVNGGYSSWY